MRRQLGTLALLMAVLLAAVSCNRSGRVIPAAKMQKIYSEMFLADQWLEACPEKKNVADTTFFYEPIFEKYGYTYKDYLATIDHYLADPERYALLMTKVVESLQSEADRLQNSIQIREEFRHKADSIAALMGTRDEDELPLYETYFYTPLRLDTISMERKKNGAYLPVCIVPDTLFDGPAFSLKDATTVDSLSVVEDTVDTPFLLLDTPVQSVPASLEGIRPMPQIKQDEVFRDVLPGTEDESPFQQHQDGKKHRRRRKS